MRSAAERSTRMGLWAVRSRLSTYHRIGIEEKPRTFVL